MPIVHIKHLSKICGYCFLPFLSKKLYIPSSFPLRSSKKMFQKSITVREFVKNICLTESSTKHFTDTPCRNNFSCEVYFDLLGEKRSCVNRKLLLFFGFLVSGFIYLALKNKHLDLS